MPFTAVLSISVMVVSSLTLEALLTVNKNRLKKLIKTKKTRKTYYVKTACSRRLALDQLRVPCTVISKSTGNACIAAPWQPGAALEHTLCVNLVIITTIGVSCLSMTVME